MCASVIWNGMITASSTLPSTMSSQIKLKSVRGLETWGNAGLMGRRHRTGPRRLTIVVLLLHKMRRRKRVAFGYGGMV